VPVANPSTGRAIGFVDRSAAAQLFPVAQRDAAQAVMASHARVVMICAPLLNGIVPLWVLPIGPSSPTAFAADAESAVRQLRLLGGLPFVRVNDGAGGSADTSPAQRCAAILTRADAPSPSLQTGVRYSILTQYPDASHILKIARNVLLTARAIYIEADGTVCAPITRVYDAHTT